MFAAWQLLYGVNHTLHNTFTQLRRYVTLLLKAIVAKLPFHFFKQSTASKGLMNRVRATEGDTQVQL